MRARIDGTDFLGANELYANYALGVLTVAARDRDRRTIHLTVLNAIRPEVIDVGAGSPNSAITAFGDAFWRSNVTGGSGTVTITRITALGAQGSFTFTGAAVPNTGAAGKRTVSGTFNVEFDSAPGFARFPSSIGNGVAK